MAGIFRTIGSTLSAIDTVASSTARRVGVWAVEEETKTELRHISRMMEIRTDCEQELANQINKRNAAHQNADVVAASQMIDSYFAAKKKADQ